MIGEVVMVVKGENESKKDEKRKSEKYDKNKMYSQEKRNFVTLGDRQFEPVP